MMEEGITLISPLPPHLPSTSCYDSIERALASRRRTLVSALDELSARSHTLAQIATLLIATLRQGGKVLTAGNGGSASEAQHFAAELVGRFKRERAPYAVLSLTTDTSILTAVANDYGYADVFARQVLALGRPGDVLVGFSTSGESENLVRAADAAHTCGMRVVAVTGNRPSRLAAHADLTAAMPVSETETIQELHMAVTHMLCDVVERELSAERDDEVRA